MLNSALSRALVAGMAGDSFAHGGGQEPCGPLLLHAQARLLAATTMGDGDLGAAAPEVYVPRPRLVAPAGELVL